MRVGEICPSSRKGGWLSARQLPQALASLLLSPALAVPPAVQRDVLAPSATSALGTSPTSGDT